MVRMVYRVLKYDLYIGFIFFYLIYIPSESQVFLHKTY